MLVSWKKHVTRQPKTSTRKICNNPNNVKLIIYWYPNKDCHRVKFSNE
uniref:Uncharacterized protein n=1 Tax=Arundo donax TaxID=35708 RepID=A0A0A8YLP5_ARUDO